MMAFSLSTASSIPSKSFLLCCPQSSTNNRPPVFPAFPPSTHFTPVRKFLSLQNTRLQNCSHLLNITCVRNHESYLDPETNPSSSLKKVEFDVKLPRRSMLVQFTCNSCGERTQRLINRLAYERGTVFVQCAGCQVHHKLIDNLGLVVEYDLREEAETDSSGVD